MLLRCALGAQSALFRPPLLGRLGSKANSVARASSAALANSLAVARGRVATNAKPVFFRGFADKPQSEGVTPTDKLNIKKVIERREELLTLPNILTLSRLVAAPIIGALVVYDKPELAVSLFAYSCVTDFLDGWIARTFNKKSVVGSVIDPAADKALMVILASCLTVTGSVPVPVFAIIIGRDIGLALSAFYIRYLSLPAPKTFKRYWDMSIPSAQVFPSTISKLNTVFQMMYLGVCLISPLVAIPQYLTDYAGYFVACTTIWSALNYILRKNSVKFIK